MCTFHGQIINHMTGLIRVFSLADVKGTSLNIFLEDLQTVVQVYGLTLRGKSTSKILGSLLSSMDLAFFDVKANKITLPLVFHSSASSEKQGRWKVDRANAVFDIKLVRHKVLDISAFCTRNPAFEKFCHFVHSEELICRTSL